ncbi:glycoside hydrolase family 13 protein [uncultured Subdoligranulum sp.]|uniref:glycoside hydrolase family 13 protein n=1 Tax=uncultured Subdoligranulum sp. TaxID=512298 RepID=UPI00261B8ACC|nr:glycoside hydrolase family 13 protein [uncultured Subdoligranulum sp.]
MNFAAVFHRAQAPWSYALNADELVLRLQTGPEVERVFLHWGDPFEAGILGGAERWHGQRRELTDPQPLAHALWWTAVIRPPYKRCRYHFELHSGGQVWLYGEDGFCTPDRQDGTHPAGFYQPWMNPADIPAHPAWVRDTIWYQIFPDRFCRSKGSANQTPWREGPVTNRERFGGDLPGICQKLDYLASLGVSGLYLNPIFAADSVHRYDTRDYTRVDPALGTNADLKQLVEQAHARGIRVMLDAVFNHCGPHFAPWRDVMENGPGSPYWDWFMVNRWPPESTPGGTRDGRYFSFAFAADMPKLNTNNPAVIDYFGTLCESWVRDYGVDGIRFDVGNEISHRMLKELRRRVRAIRPDIYLLGEIWHDASPWLEGDEYDAVMNYPLQQAVKDFFADSARTAGDLAEQLYRCLHLYRRQTTDVLFNLMDSHDTDRLFTRSGSEDAFFQQLTLLFTLPGSPCIYYGTEVALPGGHDPDCRRCMPWDKMDTPENQARIRQLQRLITLRRTLPDLKDGMPVFRQAPGARQVWYCRGRVEVLLNAGTTPWELCPEKEVLFERGLTGNRLAPGGICIRR